MSAQGSATFSQNIWKVVSHNGWLKLLSLAFALVLFLIVRSEQVREVTRTARLKIVTAPNVMVVGPAERGIDVTIKMPHSIFVQQPTDSDLVGELDVSRQKIGKLRVRLSRENFPGLDKKFALVIHDPWLEIELDNLVKKRVAVRAILQGLPKDGLSVERVIVEPRDVEISGARREVSRIDTISTSAINIEHIDRNFTSLAKLALEESSSIRVSHDKVNVQVVIGQNRVSRLFRMVPVEAANVARLDLRPPYIDVEIQGQREIIEPLRSADIRASIDSSGLSTEWQERKIALKIPPNTTLARVVPDKVLARLKK